MELWEYVNKKVKILSTDGEIFEGDVSDYVYPEDNEPKEIEGIILNNLVRGDGYEYNNPVEFTLPEIKSIEIIR